MLQEYWLLLPQRLELVQYLSPAEHGVCNRQSADYGFTPVPHFFVFDDSSFLSNTLSKFYLTEESTSTSCFSTCRAVCILESTNGWSLA